MSRALEVIQWDTIRESVGPGYFQEAVDAYRSLAEDQRERCRKAGLRVSEHFANARGPLHLPAGPFGVLLAEIARQRREGDGVAFIESRDPESIRCDLGPYLWRMLYVIAAPEPCVRDVLVRRAAFSGTTMPDLEDGVATVEFLARISAKDALDEDTYASLSDADVAMLVDWIVQLIHSRLREPTEYSIGYTLSRINCLRPGGLGDQHVKIARAGWFYPPEIYYAADDRARDEIINPQSDRDGGSYNHRSFALAMIGDAVVQRYFHEQAVKYREPLLDPHFGGWELTDGGERRDLCFADGFNLVPRGDDAIDSPVRVFHPDAQPPDAPRPLNLVVEMNPGDERLAFLGMPGTLLRFATSTAWERVFFTRVDTSGGVAPHSSSPWPEVQEDAAWHICDAPLGLGAPLVRPVMPLQRLAWPESHIGGFPRWLQDPAYPSCPDCDRHMIFLAQISSAVPALYACICRECMVAGVVTQFD